MMSKSMERRFSLQLKEKSTSDLEGLLEYFKKNKPEAPVIAVLENVLKARKEQE